MTTLTEGPLRIAGLRHMPARLMEYFAAHEGQALARDVIFREVWGMEPLYRERTLDVHVARLRKWLHADPARGDIVTYRRFGYRYVRGEQ